MSSYAWLQRFAVFSSVIVTLITVFLMSDIFMTAEDSKISSFDAQSKKDSVSQRAHQPANRVIEHPLEAETDMFELNVPIMDGLCKPTWKSLGETAQRPTWWRKAKIGMWLHWGPQSVGREGDWYAKWIYMPKYAWKKYQHVYKSHTDLYGHPSKHGYKDILPLWKAEAWYPAELMGLYRRAGARYVLAQARHSILDSTSAFRFALSLTHKGRRSA